MKHLKITSVFLTAVMMVSVVMTPSVVLADGTSVTDKPQIVEGLENEIEKDALSASVSGKCGNKLKWSLDKTGVLKINGKGVMYNYSLYGYSDTPNTPWSEYASNIKKVVISKGVTTVGAYAFYNCENLTSVSLPGSLKAINRCAFRGCSELSGISVPKDVTEIGEFAFASCSKLSGIKIPDGLTKISDGAFNGCALKSVVIPGKVTGIGGYAFGNCTELESITIPASVKTIGLYAFASCSGLKEFNIASAGLNTIGVFAFYNCKSLTKISLPLTVTKLDEYVFYECKGLEEVRLTNMLNESLSDTVFIGCSSFTAPVIYPYANTGEEIFIGDLKYSVTFPDINGNGTASVTGFSPYAKNIVVPGVVEYKGVKYKVTRIERSMYSYDGGVKDMRTLVIGSNVLSIADRAFSDCPQLVSVTGGANLRTIGTRAFEKCTKLKVFNITSASLTKIGPFAFAADKSLKTIQIKKAANLSQAGVKDSLKGSSVKNVKVRKTKVKSYQKIFKKKNCGKKVKVKK